MHRAEPPASVIGKHKNKMLMTRASPGSWLQDLQPLRNVIVLDEDLPHTEGGLKKASGDNNFAHSKGLDWLIDCRPYGTSVHCSIFCAFPTPQPPGGHDSNRPPVGAVGTKNHQGPKGICVILCA